MSRVMGTLIRYSDGQIFLDCGPNRGPSTVQQNPLVGGRDPQQLRRLLGRVALDVPQGDRRSLARGQPPYGFGDDSSHLGRV
jgi:hypothetical protein